MQNELLENRGEPLEGRRRNSRRRIAVGSALAGLIMAGSALGITSAVSTGAGASKVTPAARAAAPAAFGQRLRAVADAPPISSVNGGPGSTNFIGNISPAADSCVRADGVPEFPSPNSQGVVAATSSTLGVSGTQLTSALNACLPTSGPDVKSFTATATGS
jgi:hypothetical protein